MYTVVTHDGGFHPDEVFGVATLQLKFGVDAITVVRSRNDADITAADFVLDVGGVYDPTQRRFDHHQPGAPVRENGIPYATFGLVWKQYGEDITESAAIAAKIDEQLAQAIDANDNGLELFAISEHHVAPVTIFSVIGSYLPPWGSDVSPDDTFEEAVTFARGYLTRVIAQTNAKVARRALIESTYQSADDVSLLEFPVHVSRSALTDFPDVLMIMYPTESDGVTRYNVYCTPKAPHSFETMVQFPEGWGGLSGTDLATVSGIPDAVFCHKNRFMFIAESRAGALMAAHAVLQSRTK